MDINKMSINQVKEMFTAEVIPDDILQLIATDSRSGVRNLYKTYQRRIAALQREKQRLHEMAKFEKDLWEQGYAFVAGVDEAGRGPLAGPVVAAAVILKAGAVIEGINDSKQIKPAKRGELEKIIRQSAVDLSVGIISHEEIDAINIYQASLRAMRQAVLNLRCKPEYLLVDAVQIPEMSIPQKPIVHGDALSISIAAASIIAKETRDRIMQQYDSLYPDYGFAQHKGYGTPQHLEALRKFGPCPIHRTSFGQVSQNNT